jgi:hypothetical protein
MDPSKGSIVREERMCLPLPRFLGCFFLLGDVFPVTLPRSTYHMLRIYPYYRYKPGPGPFKSDRTTALDVQPIHAAADGWRYASRSKVFDAFGS